MKYHVFIVRGPNAASAEFDTDKPVNYERRDDAKKQASKLWDEPVMNLSAHPAHDCGMNGCNG